LERTVNVFFLKFSCELIFFSFDSYQQLELQLQATHDQVPSNDVEIQCSMDKQDQITQTTNNEKLIDENMLKTETEKFKSENDVLQDEINNLNFQLSTFIIQQTTTENVRKEVLIRKECQVSKKNGTVLSALLEQGNEI